MSMDEMLLNELYGSEEVQQEEQVKQAQVELVEAVAAEAGVDLNELDDQELTKFAHYVLSDEDETKEANFIIPGDAGMLGAYEGRKRMRRAGMNEDQIDEVQSVAGGGARSLGKGIAYGLGGALGGAALGGALGSIKGSNAAKMGAGVGAGLGSLAQYYGGYRGYKDEVDRGTRAAKKFKGRKKTAALEEADIMGRQMAHSYIDEINNITQGDDMYDDTFNKIASAMDDVAEAWVLEKEASAAGAKKLFRKAKGKLRKGYRFAMGHDATGKGGSLSKLVGITARRKGQKMYGERAARGAITAATAAGLGYGAKKGYDKLTGKSQKKEASYADLMVNELEKSASFEVFNHFDDIDVTIEKRAHLLADAGYEALAAIELCGPEEFAKEAEFRAAEILAANGVHPETFEDIEPEEVKIANFPGVESAADEHEAEALLEYNDMLDAAALHIIENIVD